MVWRAHRLQAVHDLLGRHELGAQPLAQLGPLLLEQLNAGDELFAFGPLLEGVAHGLFLHPGLEGGAHLGFDLLGALDGRERAIDVEVLGLHLEELLPDGARGDRSDPDLESVRKRGLPIQPVAFHLPHV